MRRDPGHGAGRKAAALYFLAAAFFLILFVNLARLQILKGGYYKRLSEKNRVRVIYLEGPRGKVLDRRGLVLAGSHLSFNCSAIPWEAKAKIAESARVLAPILHESPEEIEKRFRLKKPGVFNTVVVAENIGLSEAVAIEERLDALPGFMIETRPQRDYPLGESAAHLVGFTGPITEEEEESIEWSGYSRADWLGREGLEKSYESYLRGRSGGLQVEVNNRGRLVRVLGVKEPQDGKDLQVTVDSRLQAYVHSLLGSQRGAVIVMELERGGILSMNSAPSFDSNLFASARGRKDVGGILTDEAAPMMNRGIRGRYPPGSIFKIVTALAALESRATSAATAFFCPGYDEIGGNLFRCWKEEGHGTQNLTEAFTHSCNVYFFNTGVRAGVDAISAKAAEFGFSQLTGIDLPGERPGLVPSREWKRQRFRAPWYEGETANLAIGQGYLQVTPAAALLMISAVAADGRLIRPHVIEKIAGVPVAEPQSRLLRVSPENLKAVRRGLDQAVQSDSGTARLARVPGVRIGGKTGTAQSGQDKTHAWFVGFAPEENPKVAVVVFLEHGGRGGVAAASLASSVFRWLKDARYL